MIRIREGRVLGTTRSWPGAVELSVEVDGAPAAALAYPALVGTPETGDLVVLNTSAVDLGLGTGGYHLVVAIPGRVPAPTGRGGHIVKARYTPYQATVLGVSEEASPHAAVMTAATSVDGMPVVIADLHSALPAIVAGLAERRPQTRVAYVMTDGGALPLWLSRTVVALRDRLAGTVTAGQAFGGDLEAVTTHEALLAARHVLHADVAVVTQGPGNLGVGTPWGFSGVAAGDAVNAVAAVGGRAVASLRISDADPRERHRGVSHHSRTAYGRVALARAQVVVPALPEPLASDVERDLADSGIAARHDVVRVAADGLVETLERCGLPLSTMGRGLAEDTAYFVAAAAAGRHAAALLAEPGDAPA
ncbi:MAG TPA: DUF3866 family protein [Frankiaceae bacterium]|nr:DUF3866 family protein [Frankiaceae bacterium]